MNTTLQNGTDVLSLQNNLSTRRPIPITIVVNLMGFLAILGNGLVLIILGKNPKLLESTRKFCMHLAVTDLGNGFLSFIIIYSTMASGRNQIDLCVYVLLAVKFFVFASQAIVTVNTFERYIGICHRPAYLRIMKKTTVNILLFLAWLYPVVLVSVSTIGFRQSISQSSCYYHLMFKKWVYLTEAAAMFTVAAINTSLFGLIISKAWTFYRKVDPVSIQGRSETSTRNTEMKRSIRNGKMMGIVTAAFLICWLPYNVYQTYVGFGKIVSDNLVSAANTMYMIGVCNSTMNPFIYVWQKKEFRERFKMVFKCKRSQHFVMADMRTSPKSRKNTCSTQPSTTKTNLNSVVGTIAHNLDHQQEKINSPDNGANISTIEID